MLQQLQEDVARTDKELESVKSEQKKSKQLQEIRKPQALYGRARVFE